MDYLLFGKTHRDYQERDYLSWEEGSKQELISIAEPYSSEHTIQTNIRSFSWEKPRRNHKSDHPVHSHTPRWKEHLNTITDELGTAGRTGDFIIDHTSPLLHTSAIDEPEMYVLHFYKYISFYKFKLERLLL